MGKVTKVSVGLDIGEVRIAYNGEEVSGARADLISRLTFEHLQQMVETDLQGVSHDHSIEELVVPPIEVSAGMPDEAIAHATAETIFRALLNAI